MVGWDKEYLVVVERGEQGRRGMERRIGTQRERRQFGSDILYWLPVPMPRALERISQHKRFLFILADMLGGSGGEKQSVSLPRPAARRNWYTGFIFIPDYFVFRSSVIFIRRFKTAGHLRALMQVESTYIRTLTLTNPIQSQPKQTYTP